MPKPSGSVSDRKNVVADVHSSTTRFLVRDGDWNFVADTTIVTRAAPLRDFVRGLGGNVHLAFEEGAQAAWLHDLWAPLTSDLVVCDSRRNALLKDGSKSDSIDVWKLSELQRNGSLRPVYHGHRTTRTLKELAVAYRNLVRDATRSKNRLKAIFRSVGVPSSGSDLYDFDGRESWLEKLTQPGLRQRASWLYDQLATLEKLRETADDRLLEESRKHRAVGWLKSVPGIGPIGAAELVAIVDTPFRFRTKRQFWAYCGLAVVTRSSSDFDSIGGRLVRKMRAPITRGLNRNHNPELKRIFKNAALVAIRAELQELYDVLVARGLREELARVTIARKIASIALHLWKKGERFDPARIANDSGQMTPA